MVAIASVERSCASACAAMSALGRVSMTSAPVPTHMWRTMPLAVFSDQIVPTDRLSAMLRLSQRERTPRLRRSRTDLTRNAVQTERLWEGGEQAVQEPRRAPAREEGSGLKA